jgi:hypothetical protein
VTGRLPRLSLLAALLGCAVAGRAEAGAFLFARESSPDLVAHPSGYTGSNTGFEVTICADPADPEAPAVETALRNIARTWSAPVPESPNLFFGGDNNVPPAHFDFESVALHELGHCLGLDHTNVGGSGSAAPFTGTFDGPNNVFDVDPGPDTVPGSADDLRGDDVNAVYFFQATNHPFSLEAVVDASSYTRNLAALPPGDAFAASASRDVGAQLGFPDSEAVMKQLAFSDEAQRTPSYDDVATLRYAMSGLDESQGTADDYVFSVRYAGITTACDIVFRFDAQQTSFAFCSVAAQVAGNHRLITEGEAVFSSDINWFFNDVSNEPVELPALPTPGAGALLAVALATLAARRLALARRRFVASRESGAP